MAEVLNAGYGRFRFNSARGALASPGCVVRRGGLLGIWLLLLIFIVYPLRCCSQRAFLDDGLTSAR